MRHPLTGAGMSVALNDIVLLRQVLQDIPSLNEQLASYTQHYNYNNYDFYAVFLVVPWKEFMSVFYGKERIHIHLLLTS